MRTTQQFKQFLGILATLFVICMTLLNLQRSRPSFNFGSVNFSTISHHRPKDNPSKEQIPDIFARDDLWRRQTLVGDTSWINKSEDRYLFQRQWAINVSRSDYMKSLTRKKRILVDRAFNLGDDERLLPCDEDGVNMSQFCELVEDFVLLPYINYDDFDAVLGRRNWDRQFYEPHVPPRLVSFFHIEESPYTLHEGDFRPNNPILASYWRGSDIVAPYYKWLPYDNATTTNRDTTRNYAQFKHRLVAMVVSHCPTYNDRLRYVTQLQAFIPVDIYGSCGPLTCGDGCFSRISSDYKFYLAFENANCRDYITEKFFINSLCNDIVPIVLGAHRADYLAAAPPHSYIHVEDFPSPKDLADYITLLDGNDALYNEYFGWKGTGRIVSGHSDLFCRVCAFLHYADFHPPPKWPQDSYSWLKVNPCLEPGEHYWDRVTAS